LSADRSHSRGLDADSPRSGADLSLDASLEPWGPPSCSSRPQPPGLRGYEQTRSRAQKRLPPKNVSFRRTQTKREDEARRNTEAAMAEGSVAPSCLADRRWLHRELSPGRRRDHDHSCSKTPRAWDATGANRNHPKRALLIDDDNGVRNVIFDIVTSFGYVTDAAANGPEGLALFEKNLATSS